MLTYTETPLRSLDPSFLLGRAGGALTMHIRGNGQQIETVRITATKFSIGSASSCSVRLRAPRVRPVHCIVLRGPTQTVVRRWADDTRLNGTIFEDSPLQVGDEIELAGITIEVVSDTCSRAESDDVPVDRAQPAILTKMGQLVEKIDDTQSRLQAIQNDFVKSRNHDATELDARFDEIASRFQKTIEAKHESQLQQLRDEIQRLEQNIQQERDQLQERLDGWEQDKTSLHEQLRNRLADYERDRMELEQTASQLASTQRELEQARTDWDRQSAELKVDRERQIADVNGRNDELAANLASRESELNLVRGELDRRDGELRSKVAELDSARFQLHEQRQSWELSSNDRIAELQQKFDEDKAAWTNRQFELESQISQLKDKVSSLDLLEQEFDESKARHAEHEARQQEEWTAEREQLATKNDNLDAERERLESELANQQKELDRLRSELENVQQADEAKQAEVVCSLIVAREGLESELANQQKELDRLRSELDTAKQADEAEQAEAARSRNEERERLEFRGQELESEVASLTRELAELRLESQSERDEVVADYQQRLQQLEEDREMWESKRRETEAELACRNESIAETDRSLIDTTDLSPQTILTPPRQLMVTPSATRSATIGEELPRWMR